MDTKSPQERDLQSYEKEWERQLGSGGSARVLIGILVAMGIFVFLGCLPWVLSYMQDTGMIKPRIHLRFFDRSGNDIVPAQETPGTGQFGQPRQN